MIYMQSLINVFFTLYSVFLKIYFFIFLLYHGVKSERNVMSTMNHRHTFKSLITLVSLFFTLLTLVKLFETLLHLIEN